MKKIVILSILACMVLSGCSVVTLSRSGEDIESSVEGFDFHTSYFEHDSIEDLEDMEDLEDIEEPESPTTQEEIEMPEETIEDAGLDEIIQNNWSESKSIRYCGDGVYANPMSTRFQIDAPVTLSVSCATAEGKLRLKIVRMGILGDVGETIYFDETNPDGVYTVELDQKGTYKVLFYVKEHVGSVEMIASDN